MRHRVRGHGWKLVAVSILAGLALVAYLVYRQTLADNRAKASALTDARLCRYQQQDRNVLRKILLLARAASRGGHETAEQRRAADRFYTAALRLAPAINCMTLPTGGVP